MPLTQRRYQTRSVTSGIAKSQVDDEVEKNNLDSNLSESSEATSGTYQEESSLDPKHRKRPRRNAQHCDKKDLTSTKLGTGSRSSHSSDSDQVAPAGSGGGGNHSRIPKAPRKRRNTTTTSSNPMSDSPILSSQQQLSLLPPSTQQLWLTMQNYSMFLNTMTPSTRPPRRFFTLCSLADYISQFNLTDPNAKDNAETDEEYFMYQDAHSRFPSAIRIIIMPLYFLCHAPEIYLPLAPFHDAIYSAVEFTYTFHLAHRHVISFDTICNLMSGVLTNRIRHAVSHLYPNPKRLPSDSVPQAERFRPPILEWLARDTLAAFNPIEIMLMYYRPIMAEFNQISNPTAEDRLHCFKKVQKITEWLHNMHSICMMYGLHIQDSQWVSLKAWTELADCMDTIAMKIAPNLFDVVQGKHPAPASKKDRDEIFDIKEWYEAFLCCIAPCFTHHYRPMRKPEWYAVPYGNCPGWSTMRCYFPLTVYFEMLTNLPTALEQYATMYVEDPQQFECEGSQSVSLPLHDDTNGDNSHTITPSSIRQTFYGVIAKTSPKLELHPYSPNPTYCHSLALELPKYHLAWFPLQYLIRAIVECPPVNNPVYLLFESWFTHVTDHVRIMVPDPWMSRDPEFTYHHRASRSKKTQK